VLRAALGSLSVRKFGAAAHWGFGNHTRLFADQLAPAGPHARVRRVIAVLNVLTQVDPSSS
jgi:hypothetical protein